MTCSQVQAVGKCRVSMVSSFIVQAGTCIVIAGGTEALRIKEVQYRKYLDQEYRRIKAIHMQGLNLPDFPPDQNK